MQQWLQAVLSQFMTTTSPGTRVSDQVGDCRGVRGVWERVGIGGAERRFGDVWGGCDACAGSGGGATSGDAADAAPVGRGFEEGQERTAAGAGGGGGGGGVGWGGGRGGGRNGIRVVVEGAIPAAA
jgi:hypothetical protein